MSGTIDWGPDFEQEVAKRARTRKSLVVAVVALATFNFPTETVIIVGAGTLLAGACVIMAFKVFVDSALECLGDR